MCAKVQEEFDEKRRQEYQLWDFYKLWYWLNAVAEKTWWLNVIVECSSWVWIEVYQIQ